MHQAPEMETIDLRVEDGIGILSLNRPRVRNAIDGQMRADLRAAVDHVAADQSIRALVLTGAGSAFCAGGDIRGMQERLDQGAAAGEIGWRRQRGLHETLGKLYHLDRPTVAAVNGPATGLGLDLALTCDFVWMADTATVAASFIKRGLVPDGGGLFHLPRRVGVAAAKELVYSGRAVAAEEALALGLADRALPSADLLDAAVAWLRELGRLPRTAQALAKSVLNRSMELSLEEVNTLGSQAQAFCYGSAEHQDSVRAFLADRARAAAAKAQKART
ncbi:enoyl-CoA hydratase/isomerase family protein [Streptomyces hyderabadensis]|uniref:Enoyl-CoA hydratase/isomerase family protein n=1 Tax=Streptomyces hyderabadensis TaxID=598549 RepID=A0ABP9INP6_9ACTN|nr:enoyl-CoA hydratase/isomerase family protein [Streptomyces hyderabadensis]